MAATAPTLQFESVADAPRRAPAPRAGSLSEALLPDAAEWAALLGSGLGAAELHLLNDLARVRRLAPGQMIFTRDDAARTLVALRNGQAALGWRAADGSFHVERPVKAPGWLDLASAWADAQHAMDARAGADATVIELPCDALRLRLEAQPRLALRLVAALARDVHTLSLATHGLMHQDAPARFAHWLLQRAGEASVLRLAERKRDVASQLAITPETLSRLMRQLSEQGVIEVAGYTVTLRDRAALARIAAD